MNSGATGLSREHPASLAASEWALLWGIVLLAGVVRVIFFSGYFGSDEVTYTDSAFRILHGDWAADTYVGANRYGVNLPVAAYGFLFGQNLASAGMHSLVCSLAEIALVVYFARRWFGMRVGVIAGLLLACLPVHVHLAGRLMADSPLALTITASFLFFWDGETRNRPWSFALAGIAAGLSFWVKPAAIFYVGVFLAYPITYRRWNKAWFWMVAGFAAAVLANNLLFLALTGDFWFLFEALRARTASSYLETGAAAGELRDAPQYYLGLLFLRVHQTWLIGYFALAALIGALWVRRTPSATPGSLGLPGSRDAARFVGLWAIGLIALLSLLVVSWKPLMFVPKQTNYMLIFTAPLCLLAALALARLKGRLLGFAMVAILVPSLVLAGMQQGLVRVFTANSKAAVEFAASHPDALLFGTTNVTRAAAFHNLVAPHDAPVTIRPIRQWAEPPAGLTPGKAMPPRYAIVDTETLHWGSDELFRRIEDAPACWIRESRLPTRVSGAGWHLLVGIAAVAKVLPTSLGAAVAHKLEGLAMPEAAWVFRIPETGCAGAP